MQDFSIWQRNHTLEDSGLSIGRRAGSAATLPLTQQDLMLKRSLDVAVSMFLIVLFLPLLALIACALQLESGSPVFFRQRRGGLGGKPFLVVKFRTMRVCEDGPQLAQATRGDPRVTKLGAFLRRTSLDELPQLWNVLRGDMSLVGPRPHALAHDEHYSNLISRYPLRHRVKPGITGLAQVEGLRGETQTPEAMAARVEADIRYIDNWTFWGDLKILAATAMIVFFDRSAY